MSPRSFLGDHHHLFHNHLGISYPTYTTLVNLMSDDELRKEIEAGKELKKVSDDEMKAHDEEKKKRAEELEKLKEKLKAEGKWEE